MKHSINVLKQELKKEEYNLSIIPDEMELKKITWIKIESLQTAINCLELVNNNINPFTNGTFCNLKTK